MEFVHEGALALGYPHALIAALKAIPQHFEIVGHFVEIRRAKIIITTFAAEIQ